MVVGARSALPLCLQRARLKIQEFGGCVSARALVFRSLNAMKKGKQKHFLELFLQNVSFLINFVYLCNTDTKMTM